MDTSFTHREFRAVGKRAHRLGLALNYGIDAKGVSSAIDRGVNYLHWGAGGLRVAKTKPAVKEAIKKNREHLIVAGTTSLGYFGVTVRGGCESILKALGVDSLDVYLLGWLGTASAWTEATVRELLKLKEQGKVKAVGISIHNRERAANLAQGPELDLLMLRYNAAHPGAEREIFPRLTTRNQSVVAYTATSWSKLLKRPRGWDGPVMTAGDCYRFCLSNPSVDVVLTGPSNEKELNENLQALEKGPLSDSETTWIRQFGSAVHG